MRVPPTFSQDDSFLLQWYNDEQPKIKQRNHLATSKVYNNYFWPLKQKILIEKNNEWWI